MLSYNIMSDRCMFLSSSVSKVCRKNICCALFCFGYIIGLAELSRIALFTHILGVYF